VGLYGLNSSGPRQGSVEDSCEHGIELSGSTKKCWEILQWLSDWRLLKMGSDTGSLLVIPQICS
jgi:hypothetical protein